MKNKRPLIILGAVELLLLIPFIAMQFTDEVNWSVFDFVVAGVLLLGTGLGLEAVLRNVSNTTYRVLALLAVVAASVLLWLELAVGIFGTPLAGS